MMDIRCVCTHYKQINVHTHLELFDVRSSYTHVHLTNMLHIYVYIYSVHMYVHLICVYIYVRHTYVYIK